MAVRTSWNRASRLVHLKGLLLQLDLDALLAQLSGGQVDFDYAEANQRRPFDGFSSQRRHVIATTGPLRWPMVIV